MLDHQDENKIKEIFNEGVTQVMMPVLDKILDKQDEHSKDIEDVQLTANRIEMRQKAEVERVDDHEIRIGKLEKAIIK